MVRVLTFEQGDRFDMCQTDRFDGVVSLQTLSWLPDCEAPLVEVFRKLQPGWMALTSLFYPGDITCRIEVEEHKKRKKCFYNVYSLPEISRVCEREGYALTRATRFDIDIDIERPRDMDAMGTYTKRVIGDDIDGSHRLQISGPLLMNWYMVLIEKL